MTTKPPRRVPKEVAASPDEIAAAIQALTAGELGKLMRFAENRIWKLGPKAASRTADDLFQVAIDELLVDTRRWNRANVEFPVFLAGAMRSISSNWAKTYKKEETPILATDLVKTDHEGKVQNPLDKVADGATPERHMLNEEKRQNDVKTLELVEHIFKDDDKAQMVLAGWDEGYDPTVIRELWGLSQTEYNTIVRRIRRTLEREGVTTNGSEGKTDVQ